MVWAEARRKSEHICVFICPRCCTYLPVEKVIIGIYLISAASHVVDALKIVNISVLIFSSKEIFSLCILSASATIFQTKLYPEHIYTHDTFIFEAWVHTYCPIMRLTCNTLANDTFGQGIAFL